MKRSALSLLSLAVLAAPVWGLASKRDTSGSTQRSLQKRFGEAQSEQLATLAKTQGLLDEKYTLRNAERKRRIRAMYKLSRASWPQLWFEPEARLSTSRWLGAARKITSRDAAELRLLEEEMAVAEAAKRRLDLAASQELPTAPEAKSLLWPVDDSDIAGSFGDYKGPTRRVRLHRRGVQLEASAGALVRAPYAARVRYLGPISGLGQAVILDHRGAQEGTMSIIAGLEEPGVEVGQVIEQGALLAKSAGSALYMEVRLRAGSVGMVLDPTALFD